MKFYAGDIWPTFGVVGFVYEGTIGALWSMILATVIGILAIIGLITIIKTIVRKISNRKKETPGEKWMRTGRMD